MEKISDTTVSVFHIAIKVGRPALCTSEATVWSEIFGLGWRFGFACNPKAWFPKVRLYLDHNHTQTEQDQATVSVCLRDTADKDAKQLKERVTTISNFGHGEPALLGSWSASELASHPYVSLTVTTKTRLPGIVTIPLPSTSLALRQSLESGNFIDAKFYVFSAKRPGHPVSKPRVVYASSTSIGVALPKSASAKKQGREVAPSFLVNMINDRHINEDSMLHEYEYEQDSDLDDEENHGSNVSEPQRVSTGSKAGGVYDEAEDEFPARPPTYSVSDCRMILVKGVAYKTWLAYIYFRYTGQVFFRPLKSASGSSQEQPDGTGWPPSSSPKSMYRLAERLGDEKMKELARRALYEGLSKDNIVEEAFSWFTAQYAAISKYEVEKVLELRKSSEVSLALRLQLKTVSHGEKPWAQDVLVAIMEKLNSSESSI